MSQSASKFPVYDINNIDLTCAILLHYSDIQRMLIRRGHVDCGQRVTARIAQ